MREILKGGGNKNNSFRLAVFGGPGHLDAVLPVFLHRFLPACPRRLNFFHRARFLAIDVVNFNFNKIKTFCI